MRNGTWIRRVTMGLAALAGAALGTVPAGGVAGATTPLPNAIAEPFWLVTPSGQVEGFRVASLGSPAGPLNQPIVATETTADRKGYWLVAADGGVFTYGDAHFYGSTGSLRLNQPIVAMATTPDQHGYWLIAADGGVFSFGDARFFGSTGNLVLNRPIVGATATSDGHGYWLVASDGGVFSFGDATFEGSAGGTTLPGPVVWMTATPDHLGYWLATADGSVESYGDARSYGSDVGTATEPVGSLVSTSDGRGYWILQQNGTATAFGDATGQTLPDQILLFRPLTAGDRAVLFAFDQLGKPYIWGGNGPVGYDCSGLALASWEHGADVGFARVADDQYHTAGTPVAMDQLAAGDLVFWGTSATDWTSVYHTAIYVGGDDIVESTGTEVQLNTLDQWSMAQVMPEGRHP